MIKIYSFVANNDKTNGNRKSMNMPLLTFMREDRCFSATVATLTLFFFVFVFYSPSALAIKTDIEQKQQTKAAIKGKTAEKKLSKTLQAIKEHVKKNNGKIKDRVAEEAGFIENMLDIFGLSTLATEDTQALTQLNDDVQQLHEEALANFASIEQDLIDKGLPKEILQRQYDAVAKYQAEYIAFQEKINQLNAAGSLFDQEVAIEELDTFLDKQQFKRSQQKFDPNKLPNQSLKPNPDKKPKLKQEDYTKTGLHNTPYIQLAALGDFTFDKLPGADDPAYLAGTVEVTLSQAIQDQAAELGHDPVRIANWVRNTIEWLPTWGAMQDAELTLASRRGNALDIAGLTLALLRSSGIPARYVQGTLQVREDRFRNWAGGFSDINAAIDYAASGGIPIAPVVSGGKIGTVQMEHIWVEAAIDYFPSKGAKNLDADSWLQMDPSFKQYEYLEGLDAVEISGIDPQQLAQAFINSGAVNEQEGWVTGFDPTLLEDA
ncbi:MAG: hypothetical protein GY727_16575, partial [Gammaproteobacteria bacterium]|nr:hypothetical protein [Gammaproteobacteria bacterium]